MACLRCTVNGRVQGVFFRASTQKKAYELGINGHAKNLDDGSVEVLACGEADAVERLRQWLRQGPPMARVSSVHCEPANASCPAGFVIA